MNIVSMPIDSIVWNGRKRTVAAGKVASLAASIEQNGLINPVTLDESGKLLAGLHRIEACKMLAWETIPARIIEGIDALQAELVEIDENLIRNDLTPLQQGEWLLRRDEVLREMGVRADVGWNGNQYTSTLGVGGDTVAGPKTTADIAAEVGMSPRSAQRKKQIARDLASEAKDLIAGTDLEESTTGLLKIARLPQEQQAAVAQRVVSGEARSVEAAIQSVARERQPEAAETPPLPEGKYRCIVIDPPWPMKKIEREKFPTQGLELDYPTMTIEEIQALPVADLTDENGCHLYLWVTQKYLPAGLELVQRWGFKYQCLMTWRKNVGFTPFSWMYDTEHVIFATLGGLKLQKMGLRLSFDAPVNGHSVKPDVFYSERVIPASPEPRLEMFARRERDGFEVWGNEINGS